MAGYGDDVDYFSTKIILFLIFSLSVVDVYAYSPKLLLLEDNGLSQIYLDQQSKKQVARNTMQVMMYEKFASPTFDDAGNGYQSSIKKILIDCKYQAVAEGGAAYYLGKTSNSGLVSRYDDTVSRDGETGKTNYSYDDLDYISIKGSKFNKKIYEFACSSE